MQLFQCSYCQHPIYFDNTQCTVCQHHLGFDAQYMHMLALQPGQRAGEFVEAVTQRLTVFARIISIRSVTGLFRLTVRSSFVRPAV